MTKTLSTLGLEGNYLNLVRKSLKNTATIAFNGELLQDFYLRSADNDAHHHYFYPSLWRFQPVL